MGTSTGSVWGRIVRGVSELLEGSPRRPVARPGLIMEISLAYPLVCAVPPYAPMVRELEEVMRRELAR